MPHEFLISYAGPKTCELFASPAGITLYVPRREGYEAAVELDTTSYTAAEVEAARARVAHHLTVGYALTIQGFGLKEAWFATKQEAADYIERFFPGMIVEWDV